MTDSDDTDIAGAGAVAGAGVDAHAAAFEKNYDMVYDSFIH